MNYKGMVIGAGHAGLEAAFAFANKKMRVALVLMDEKLIGNMPCNPSIGGPAKGIVTREIDALGGMQGIAADACQLQMKLLNSSKGAGVRALRAQIDKIEYHNFFKKLVNENEYIDLIIGEAQEILINNNKAIGLKINNKDYFSDTVIIATGTFLDSKVFIGNENKQEGPDGFSASTKLAKNIKEIGFETVRLKTGTPPRLNKHSLDYSQFQLEPGTDGKYCFSHFNCKFVDIKDQEVCYLVHTNSDTHEIIRNNLKDSPMYGGEIIGIGPRYCPSIEDKVVRFHDKERHQIFIEPESKQLDTVYLAGISSSLPKNVQEQMVRSIKGMENAEFIKYAYAIEYDSIKPEQLYPSLESKKISNLFFAGQINGTSGYEEAAGQGLIAGINAILKIENKKPLILSRSEAYIGVMIDDIVTKEISEPYRLLTSRAEHRLELRNDNADERLIKYGYEIGLISEDKYNLFNEKMNKLNKNIEMLKNRFTSEVKDLNNTYKKSNMSLYDLIKRPDFTYEDLKQYIDAYELDHFWEEKINIKIKYDGYIKNQKNLIQDYEKLSKTKLSINIDYKKVNNLSLEAIDKLNKFKPIDLGQASRISGVTFNDLINIKFFLKGNNNE
ncbi:MAG: tRNA uridine-5-carboxymethylaminomethyl(34) synthesis enzyme MnmG [Mycoplasmoidaceae bacterium]